MNPFLRHIGATMLIGIFLPAATPRAQPAEDLSIYFLDVGQGDATILHQPTACTIVIDAGPLLNGHKVTQKLQALGVSSIDMLIVTHPHLDHFGGLFDIAPRLPIKRFFDNGATNPNREYFDDYQRLRQDLPYQELIRGDDLECGDVNISVLYPDAKPAPGDDLNGTSLALLITYGDFRLLHMGDLAGPAVDRFLELGDKISAPVLKVAHHGAADAAAKNLLERVKPAHAIISTATQNRIASPSGAVLQRLSDSGATYYRTDRDGTITLLVNQDGYRVVSP